MQLSVVIPVLLDNRVFETIQKLRTYFQSASIEYEFIISGKIKSIQSIPKDVRLVHASGRKGENLIAGIQVCRGEYVLLIDADLPTLPECIGEILARSERFDIVFGKRIFYDVKTRFPTLLYRRVRTMLFKAYVCFLFPTLWGYDTQFGVKLFKLSVIRRLLLEKIHCLGLAFDVEISLRISKSRLSICHVPVVYVHSKKSVINPISSAWELVINAMYIRFFLYQ